MKRRRVLYIVVTVIVVLALLYAFEPSNTPSPQPPLVTLSSADFGSSFYSALNRDPQANRLILLVSPT